ncbi:MAG: HD domain-containing protein [Dehalococcoidales bacterium]|nr:HD domain-containing protein [Dehalococcoidales bacterium]
MSRETSKTNIESAEYKERLELLYEVAQKASSVSEVSNLLEEILGVTQRILQASASSLLLIDEEKGALYFQAAGGQAGSVLRQMRLDLGIGIAGWVARNNKPLIVNDVTKDERFNEQIDIITDFVTKSIIAVPLVRAKRVVGVLEVLNKADGSLFTERDMTILTGFVSTEALILLASMAATAMHNITLRQTLLDGYKSTVETLASMADAKDPYAYEHSRRVKDYALIVANSLSFSAEEMEAIEYGALLHDIGKIGISDNILCKAGPLTDMEWYVVRKHPLSGANILGEIPFLEKARDIVLYHHERYDGTGYPHKLKGKAIPVGARLVAVADAFDTMTTDHSYCAARSVDEAINELIKCKGTHLCPSMVDAFVSAFDKHEWKLAKKEIGRMAREKGKRDVEEAKRAKEAEKLAEKEARRADKEKAKKEVEKAGKTHDISADIYEGDVQLVVPSPVGFEQVTRFEAYLKKNENIRIVLVGGSEDKGAAIVVSLQEPMPLVRILNELPMVDSVDKIGKNIVVTLKTLVAG